MKKVFLIFLATIAEVWLYFYIGHAFRIEEWTEAWWGFPYFFTCSCFILLTVIGISSSEIGEK